MLATTYPLGPKLGGPASVPIRAYVYVPPPVISMRHQTERKPVVLDTGCERELIVNVLQQNI